MVIYNRHENSIHLVELTVPFETNINKAHDRKHKKYLDLVSDIADNGFICDLTCFGVGSRGLITPENVGYIAKAFSFVGAKHRKTFLRELSKLALLPSYTIWNARQVPAWSSENQPLICLWSFSLPFHLLLPLSVSSCFCFLFLLDLINFWFVIFCLLCIALR